jgi:hypothetical protein
MRRWLAAWGLAWTLAGAVAFANVGQPVWAAVCAVLAAATAIDLVVVVRHLRQGPHYQPGPDVPPYEPVHDEDAERHPSMGRPGTRGPGRKRGG